MHSLCHDTECGLSDGTVSCDLCSVYVQRTKSTFKSNQNIRSKAIPKLAGSNLACSKLTLRISDQTVHVPGYIRFDLQSNLHDLGYTLLAEITVHFLSLCHNRTSIEFLSTVSHHLTSSQKSEKDAQLSIFKALNFQLSTFNRDSSTEHCFTSLQLSQYPS